MTWRALIAYLPIVVALLAVYYFKNYFKSVFLAFKIPGPTPLPILGHALLLKDSKQMEHLACHMSALYGPVVRFWVSLVPVFLIYEPDHLQMILSTSKNSTKNMFYTFLNNLLGQGLVTLKGDKWKTHRRLIQPYFQLNVLKTLFNVFLKHSHQLVCEFSDGTDVNIVALTNRFVLNVMHDAVFGVPIKDERESSLFRSCKVSMLNRACKPWLLFNALFKMTKASKDEMEHKSSIQEYVKKQLDSRKGRTEKRQECNKNVMDMLLEIAEKNTIFTEKDVVNETASFILVGQDSVATALAFTLYFLAAHQEVQAKVMNELNEIYKDDHDETYEDTVEMKYLEQCIRESLRLCPSLPLLGRTLTKEVCLGKVTLPPGTNIAISPFVTHRLPHVFPNPLEFNPDRFSAANIKNIHPYAYIPFSAGPRNCIGYKFALMELKTVISHILRSYHVSLVPGHEKLNLLYSITLKAKGGIWLRFRQRENEFPDKNSVTLQ